MPNKFALDIAQIRDDARVKMEMILEEEEEHADDLNDLLGS